MFADGGTPPCIRNAYGLATREEIGAEGCQKRLWTQLQKSGRCCCCGDHSYRHFSPSQKQDTIYAMDYQRGFYSPRMSTDKIKDISTTMCITYPPSVGELFSLYPPFSHLPKIRAINMRLPYSVSVDLFSLSSLSRSLTLFLSFSHTLSLLECCRASGEGYRGRDRLGRAGPPQPDTRARS